MESLGPEARSSLLGGFCPSSGLLAPRPSEEVRIDAQNDAQVDAQVDAQNDASEEAREKAREHPLPAEKPQTSAVSMNV